MFCPSQTIPWGISRFKFGRRSLGHVMACVFVLASQAAGQTAPPDAVESMSRAANFYSTQVAVSGSYLWTYSSDLQTRQGEGVATASQGWVQEPGTPAVGTAYLQAYDATGDAKFLTMATTAALALVRTQQGSGGWHSRLEFDADRKSVV